MSATPAVRARRWGVSLCTLATLLTVSRPVTAQKNPCSVRHPMVDYLQFKGNRSLSSDVIASGISTERTGLFRRWFGWNTGALTCLDEAELKLDVVRVRELYDVRGFPGTKVSSGVTRRGERRAQVTFTIQEAAPIRVASVKVVGLPPEAANAGAIERRLRDQPLDSLLLAMVTDSIQRLIQNAGYARAQPPSPPTAIVDSVTRRAALTLTFLPGRVIYIGTIGIVIKPVGTVAALPEHAVAALLRFKQGERFSALAVGATQRDLYDLELYRSIRIDTTHSATDTVPVSVNLIEGDRRRLRVAGGWGTLDCFRTQERFVSENFLHSGHRLELNGKLSKIGLSAPLTGLSALCAPRLRDDPYSQQLNYYVGATINLRGIPGANLKPTLTVYSERRSEFAAYQQSTTVGVVASVTREFVPHLFGTLQYQFVDGKTIADGAVSCTRFGFCRAEDLRSFLESSPIHSLSAEVVKNPLLPTDDPVTGQRWQVGVREGYTTIARTDPLTFTRMTGEAAAYRPLGPDFVVAVRVQMGYVFAPQNLSYLLPPPERFYSGGQNTVRGYPQNYLGPGSYIVRAPHDTAIAGGTTVGMARPVDGYLRIAPSGGNAMWLANIELRTRAGWPAGLLRWVGFVDAGRVWNTNDVFNVTNSAPRITPGVGVRLLTPIGPFRVDVGYNPYAYEAGPAFYVQDANVAAGQPGRAICVSPGTTEPLMPASGSSQPVPLCPATFLPLRTTSVFSRLVFHFSIGNAF